MPFVSLDELHTRRLLLRRWREDDLAPFAAMNADPEVMELFPSPLDRASSDNLVGRIERGFAEHGFGLWALHVASSGGFIGFTGLSVPGFEAAFTPAVEVGWRLAREAWGHGYVTEAATTALDAAFGPLALAEVVSFTSVANVRSQAVMRRLDMTRDPAEDFDHPSFPAGHRLAGHVLYRTTATRWQQRTALTGEGR